MCLDRYGLIILFWQFDVEDENVHQVQDDGVIKNVAVVDDRLFLEGLIEDLEGV